MASRVTAITSHLHSEHKPLKISQLELPDEFCIIGHSSFTIKLGNVAKVVKIFSAQGSLSHLVLENLHRLFFFFSRLHIVFLDKVDKYCCLGGFRCGLTTEHFVFLELNLESLMGRNILFTENSGYSLRPFHFIWNAFYFLYIQGLVKLASDHCLWMFMQHMQYQTNSFSNVVYL